MITESAPIERRRSINFYDFLAAHSGIFVKFLSKKLVILDENCPKLTIVCLKCASWRSIGADTVIQPFF